MNEQTGELKQIDEPITKTWNRHRTQSRENVLQKQNKRRKMAQDIYG